MRWVAACSGPLINPFTVSDTPRQPRQDFETIPSSPILQACRKTSSHHPTVCHADRQKRSPMTRVPTTHSPIWRPSANCVQRPPRSAALFLSAIRCTWRASGLNAGASIVSMTAFWATIRSRWQAAQFGSGTWRAEIASQTPRACYWERDLSQRDPAVAVASRFVGRVGPSRFEIKNRAKACLVQSSIKEGITSTLSIGDGKQCMLPPLRLGC